MTKLTAFSRAIGMTTPGTAKSHSHHMTTQYENNTV